MDLKEIRREYLKGGLDDADLRSDPLAQFSLWMEQALAMELGDPTAMVLATVDGTGQPGQRIVLLKDVDEHGFVFYTNYNSHKARDIESNPRVGLHFPWHAIERQVNVAGVAEKVSGQQSRDYFHTRPRESQLAAWASAQSQALASRDELMEHYRVMENRFAGSEIPLPPAWGGYRVRPERMEFWQGGARRLHDRFVYTRGPEGWHLQRLAP